MANKERVLTSIHHLLLKFCALCWRRGQAGFRPPGAQLKLNRTLLIALLSPLRQRPKSIREHRPTKRPLQFHLQLRHIITVTFPTPLR